MSAEELSATEAAEVLGMTRERLRQLAASGALPPSVPAESRGARSSSPHANETMLRIAMPTIDFGAFMIRAIQLTDDENKRH